MDRMNASEAKREQYVRRTFMKYSRKDIGIDKPGTNLLLNANEAVARGAIEAGVRVAAGYPGSPLTYVIDNLVEATKMYPSLHVEWSDNEKIAYDVCWGTALAGMRAICIMKNEGVNVALDSVAHTQWHTAPGLVVAVGDDPGSETTTNEQDTRLLAPFMEMPWLEPTNMQEVKDLTVSAFELSERIRLPVFLRIVVRLAYARGPVVLGSIRHDIRERAPQLQRMAKANTYAVNYESGYRGMALAHRLFHNEVSKEIKDLLPFYTNVAELQKSIEEFSGNELRTSGKTKLGVIAAGMAYLETLEALKVLGMLHEVGILKLVTLYPIPRNLTMNLLANTDTVLIAEEIEPFIENQVRAISAEMEHHATICGKGTGHLPFSGEIERNQIGVAIAALVGKKFDPPLSHEASQKRKAILDGLGKVGYAVGEQCPGCPGRAAGYALKLTLERLGMAADAVYIGDDGCCSLFDEPPISLPLTMVNMGAGSGLVTGMHWAGVKGKKIVVVGDGTFFHAGVPGLLNAVYNRAEVLFFVNDNRSTAMTGHQPHPGAFGITAAGEDTKIIDIVDIVRACQADYVAEIDPYDLCQSYPLIEQALTTKGVSVIVSRRTCALLAQRQKGARDALLFDKACFVSKDKCLSWMVETSPCQAACPLHMDVEGYVSAIAAGDLKKAVSIIRETNPLPGVCGRVCHQPCEDKCKRREIDEPLSIAGLKRFAADVELSGVTAIPAPYQQTKKAKVAVIGSGPCGLAAAYELAKRGYPVTVFEKKHIAGGMLSTAIPEFILPKEVVERDIEYIRNSGVEIRLNSPVEDIGSVFEWVYKAVFVATGAAISSKLSLPGVNLPNILYALPFLEALKSGKTVNVGEVVMVIGGGNVAIDTARYVLRIGAKTVNLVCLESREDMPAFREEIEAAEREGVRINPSLATQQFRRNEADDSVWVDLTRVISTKLNKDGSISWTLEEGPGNSLTMQANTVIVAIGQRPDLSLVKSSNLRIIDEGIVLGGSDTLATNLKGVFVGGDAVRVGGTVVAAIADGQKAADSIDRYLQGQDIISDEGEGLTTKYSGEDLIPEGIARKPRQIMLTLPMEQRMHTFAEVEVGFSTSEAIEEAQRCLKCKTCSRCVTNFGCPAIVWEENQSLHRFSPRIDSDMCTGCLVCLQICPYKFMEAKAEATPA